MNNFVALFLAFHWPVFVTLFNWDVGSVEGVGSSLVAPRLQVLWRALGLLTEPFWRPSEHCESGRPWGRCRALCCSRADC